jgi:hypothetical protein
MFEPDIVKLKGVLGRKEYEKAGYKLTAVILKAYEQRILKSRIWTYVAKVQFDKEVTTAQINLKTGFVTFGVDFFVKHINCIEDLLFLIIHERNHYILEHSIWRSDLYYLRLSLPAPLPSLVEDAFINGAAYRTSPSRISDRFYKHNSIAVILTSDSKGVGRVFKNKEIVKIHSQLWDTSEALPDFGKFSGLLIHWFFQKMKEERREHEKQGQKQAQENKTQSVPGDGDGKDQNNTDGGQNFEPNQDVTDNDQGANQTEDRSEDTAGQEEKNNTTGTSENGDESGNEGEGFEECGKDDFKSEIETETETITPIVEGQHDTSVSLEDQKSVNPVVYSESGAQVHGRKIKALTPKSEIDKALASLTRKEREQFSVQRSFDISQLDTFISDFQCLKAGQDGLQGYTSTVPHRISKRDINSIQMGGMPVIWNVSYEGFEKHTKLYMDVSGSMDSYLGLIPYLFDRLMEHVDEIFEFSTVIVKVDPGDNYYYTTGGTSFNTVAEHILNRDFQSVIVITDGCGNLSEDLTEKLRNHLDYCVYIRIGGTRYPKRTGWGKVANQVIHIVV